MLNIISQRFSTPSYTLRTFAKMLWIRFNMMIIWGLNSCYNETTIWNHRNRFNFRNERVLVEVSSLIQRKIWSWITVKERLSDFSYLDWCLEPIYCMRYLKKMMFVVFFLTVCLGLEVLLWFSTSFLVFVVSRKSVLHFWFSVGLIRFSLLVKTL